MKKIMLCTAFLALCFFISPIVKGEPGCGNGLSASNLYCQCCNFIFGCNDPVYFGDGGTCGGAFGDPDDLCVETYIDEYTSECFCPPFYTGRLFGWYAWIVEDWCAGASNYGEPCEEMKLTEQEAKLAGLNRKDTKETIKRKLNAYKEKTGAYPNYTQIAVSRANKGVAAIMPRQ